MLLPIVLINIGLVLISCVICTFSSAIVQTWRNDHQDVFAHMSNDVLILLENLDRGRIKMSVLLCWALSLALYVIFSGHALAQRCDVFKGFPMFFYYAEAFAVDGLIVFILWSIITSTIYVMQFFHDMQKLSDYIIEHEDLLVRLREFETEALRLKLTDSQPHVINKD